MVSVTKNRFILLAGFEPPSIANTPVSLLPQSDRDHGNPNPNPNPNPDPLFYLKIWDRRHGTNIYDKYVHVWLYIYISFHQTLNHENLEILKSWTILFLGNVGLAYEVKRNWEYESRRESIPHLLQVLVTNPNPLTLTLNPDP